MKDTHLKDAILCTGGADPGISVFDVFTGRLHPVLSLKSGESIYTADISADGKVIVAGSKSGYLFYAGLNENFDACNPIRRFFIADPVLSVLFINDHTIAASDSAGKVVLWDRDDERNTRVLDSCREPICSLYSPNDYLLCGVSISGQIYLWDLMGHDRPAIIRGYEPPVIYGLVDVIAWKGAWVWPDYAGRIILFDVESRRVDLLDAHSGAVYAICTYNDYLVSLGKSDGILKFWKFGVEKPVETMTLAHGVVSMAMWDQRGTQRCLTVDENGQARTYTIRDQEVTLTKTLDDTTYRKVIGPCQSRITEYLNAVASNEIEQVYIQIKQKIDDNDMKGLPTLYNKLDTMGAGTLGLWLRAYQAEKEDDVYGQLERYYQLYDLLEPDQRQSLEYLTKYTDVLRRTWQLRTAICVLRENSGKKRSLELRQLQQQAQTLSKTTCIIAPGVKTLDILKASKLLDEKIKARIICKYFPSYQVDADIDPHEFMAKYEDLRKFRYTDLPGTQLEQVNWLTDDTMTQEVVMMLKPHQSGSCLESIVKLTSEHSRTVIETAIALNTQRFYEMDTQVSDTSIRSMIESNGDGVGGYETVRLAIKNVAQQYITKSKSVFNLY